MLVVTLLCQMYPNELIPTQPTGLETRGQLYPLQINLSALWSATTSTGGGGGVCASRRINEQFASLKFGCSEHPFWLIGKPIAFSCSSLFFMCYCTNQRSLRSSWTPYVLGPLIPVQVRTLGVVPIWIPTPLSKSILYAWELLNSL